MKPRRRRRPVDQIGGNRFPLEWTVSRRHSRWNSMGITETSLRKPGKERISSSLTSSNQISSESRKIITGEAAEEP